MWKWPQFHKTFVERTSGLVACLAYQPVRNKSAGNFSNQLTEVQTTEYTWVRLKRVHRNLWSCVLMAPMYLSDYWHVSPSLHCKMYFCDVLSCRVCNLVHHRSISCVVMEQVYFCDYCHVNISAVVHHRSTPCMLMESDVLLWTSQGYIWFYEHTLQAASLSQILVSIPMFYFQFTAQLTTLYNWAMFTLLHRGTSKSVNWHMKCPSRPPVVSIFILSRAKNFYSPLRLFYALLTANCGFYIYIFYSSGTHLTVFSHFCFIFHFMARRCLSLSR